MKTPMLNKERNWLDAFHHVRHFEHHQTEPLQFRNDRKGIRCEGDNFRFIVDWQVDQKKQSPKASS